MSDDTKTKIVALLVLIAVGSMLFTIAVGVVGLVREVVWPWLLGL